MGTDVHTPVQFHFGEAEVGELDVALVADQHVVRFQVPEERSRGSVLVRTGRSLESAPARDVPVNDAVPVKVIQRQRHLGDVF